MTVHIYTQQHQIEGLLPILMARPAWGWDTETTGVDAHKDKVIAMQFGNQDEQHIIDTRNVNIEPLRPFLESEEHKKIAHFSIFDYMMTKGTFGIDVENLRCTFLAEQCLNTGRKKSGFGYAALVASYLGEFVSKAEQKSFINFSGEFSEQQFDYMAKDVRHLISLSQRQCQDLIATGTAKTWILECEAVPCFGDMQFDGVVLDKDHWSKLIEKNIKRSEELQIEMNEFASLVFDKDIFGNVDVNYGSPAQMLELLQKFDVKIKDRDPKSGETVVKLIDKTDDKTIKKIVNPFKLTKLLKEYRGSLIRVNTFGYPFIAAIHPLTGRLHPDIKQMGTETGRPAKGKDGVNFLNIPRDKEFRKGFRGEVDELVETDDYSGCELRIWASLSKDPTLIEAFNRGEDVHCKVASKLFKQEVDKKSPLRTKTKTINFGIAYGMGVGQLHESMAAEDPTQTFEMTKTIFRDYNEEMHVGVEYLREAGRLAAKQGYLSNLNGRRRYWILPDPSNRDLYPQGDRDRGYIGVLKSIERAGGNFKIQSVNADITKYAMILIRRYIKKNKVRSKFMNQVYDEIVTRTHKDDSPSFHEIKVKLMREAAEHWITDIPMEVEGEVLPYWTK